MKFWCSLSSFIFVVFIASGQQLETTSIPRLNEEIKFDGKVDEELWSNIAPLPMTSHWPNHGQAPYKNTIIKVAYVDEYLYVAAICYEDNDNIQESTFARDGNWNLQSDHVTITLDTYNDDENAVMFVVSPSGARTDISVRNDFISGEFSSTAWNAIWNAKVDVFEGGWQTEFRIPFNVLRFETKDNVTNMGLSVYRYSAHDKKLDTYPAISNEFGFFSFSKPSFAQNVTFENIENKRPLFLEPFMVASRSRQNLLNTAGDDYEEVTDENLSFGFNAQYAVNNNLSADLTFNTDFAQVEADNQQVNLTRFSLFFPERRRFFQERSSTFEFNNDGNNKLFYSRRIGVRDGQLVPLWGGVRLVGRVGKSDFGVLTMQSKETADFGSENYGVIRFRSDVINENSYVGGMLTTVAGPDGAYNVSVGTDALLNLFGKEYLRVSLSHAVSDIDSSGSFLDKSRIFIEWEKRKNVGFGYRLNFGQVGNKYNPALGFENRLDYWRVGDRIFYNFWMKESSSLQKINLSLNSNLFVNRSTDELESANINPRFEMIGKNEFSFSIGPNSFYDIPSETFNISDKVFIVPGAYWNHTVNVDFSTPRVKRFVMSGGYNYGGYYGGTISAPSLTFDYLPNKYLKAAWSTEYNNVQIPEFKTFESVITRVSLALTFNVKWTFSSFAQYNSARDLWAINSRLRFNPRDGVNVFLVFNGNYNVDTEGTTPLIPTVASNVFILKYSHTFIL